MKLYGEENPSKSWALSFKRECSDVILVACDASTGRIICNIIFFKKNGKITIATSAKKAIENNGYDPYEHGNKFDKEGRIIIGDKI